MRISEMLEAIASWLENPDENEAILLAEYNDKCLEVVAQHCVEAAACLKKAAGIVENLEPVEPSVITAESLEELSLIAEAFDASGDPALKKQASVIDELLLSIAAPPDAYKAIKAAKTQREEDLKKKYENPRSELESFNKVEDSKKAIDQSEMTKDYRVLEAPLSTRYCPDHAGVPVIRVGDHIWQCELDKKVYNFDVGFELNNGNRVPGGGVEYQTQPVDIPSHVLFDSREDRMGRSH